ncbi:MAG: hypothetical protein ACK5OC_25515 [Pirellula sp.]|jgi:hypothetical protein
MQVSKFQATRRPSPAKNVIGNMASCVDDEACIPECPIEAIFYEDNVPTPWLHYIELNSKRSKECPPAQPKSKEPID